MVAIPLRGPPDWDQLAFSPPPGVTVNKDDPDTAVLRLLIPLCVMALLSTSFTVMRTWTRAVILRSMCTEDYLLILGWLGVMVNVGVIVASTKYGLGRHIWQNTWGMFIVSYRLFRVTVTLYILSMTFVKVSILLFYMRISPIKMVHRISWALIFVIVGAGITLISINIFGCIPLSKVWDFFIKGKCLINGSEFILGNGIANIVTDFCVLLLVIPILWQIALPRKQKIGVAFLLATGGFVCVVSILRLIFATSAGNSFDATYEIARVYIWSEVEVHVAVVCACMPSLKPFVKHYAQGRSNDWLDEGSDFIKPGNLLARRMMVAKPDKRGKIKMRSLNILSSIHEAGEDRGTRIGTQSAEC